MSETQEPGELRFHGVGVSPGIARGHALVSSPDDEELSCYSISEDAIPDEIARFEAALVATRAQIVEMQQEIAEAIGSRDAGIFDAHLLVVEDQTLIDEVLRLLVDERKNIECVFHQVAQRYAKTLGEIDDPYLRERALDIQDVSKRVTRNLLGKSPRTLAHSDEPHVIVAHDITPSDTATMNRDLVLGFATDVGSKTSHTAIVASSLGIPAVVGLHSAHGRINNGDYLLLDGYSGLLIVNPSVETLQEYGSIEAKKDAIELRLDELRETESTTQDGRHIVLAANIELPGDLDAVRASGAEGVGLYRTEFFFLNRSEPPNEEDQFENYKTTAEKVLPHNVIIRTLDLGGDKFAASVPHEAEANPFLGWRAIRFCLEHPDIFKPQLRAILRASVFGNVQIMYPMISGVDELRRANAVLETCKEELRAEGKPFKENIEVGAMIEIPSAAVSADILAREVDFFSIGTNDLIQYTIAVDRLNENISHLYQPTHPALIRLIKMVVDAAHANGKWVGVCGEMAGEPELVPLLLGLGVDELSAGAAVVPRVKRAVQSLDTRKCKTLVDEVMGMDSPFDILERCRAIAAEHYPEVLGIE